MKHISLIFIGAIFIFSLGCTDAILSAPKEENFINGSFYFVPSAFPAPYHLNKNISYELIFPNFVWNHTDFKVYIDEETHKNISWFSEDVIKEIENAFDMWEESTENLITFQRVYNESEADIKIYWQRYFGTSETGIKIGEAQPVVFNTFIVNHSIASSVIQIPYKTSCVNKIIAAHEIGHSLGLGHTKNTKSIMFPYIHCFNSIQQEEIDAIKEMYSSISSIKDLIITDASVNQTNNYLNGSITIQNQGIFRSPKMNLSLYGNSDLLRSYELDELSSGYSSTFAFSNLFVKELSENITIRIEKNPGFEELNYENNELILSKI